MLNGHDLSVLTRIRAALATAGDKALAALGQELDAVLVRHAEHAASVQRAAQRRGPRGKRGAVALRYVLEVEPGWVEHVAGALAARQAVVDTLAKLGAKRTVPAARSFAAMLSAKGYWATLVDTDNGTVSITVRKAPEQPSD